MMALKSRRGAIYSLLCLPLVLSPVMSPAAAFAQSETVEEELRPATGTPRSVLFSTAQPGPYVPPVVKEVPPSGPQRPIDQQQVSAQGAGPSEMLGGMTEQDASVTAFGDIPTDEIIGESLGKPDVQNFGLLNMGQSGLSYDMWAGSSLSQVAGLLSRLPTYTETFSPTMQQLQRRLLLTAAKAPEGAPPAAAGSAPNAPINFLGLRLEKLAAQGALTDHLRFLDLLQGEEVPDLQRAVGAYLLGDNYAAACARSRQALEHDSRPYWLKVVAFCRALDGNEEGALLAVDLLREQGVKEAAFYDLINMVLRQEKNPDLAYLASYNMMDPLLYAMVRVLGQVPPRELWRLMSPQMTTAMAMNPLLDNAARLEQAYGAYLSGNISADVIKELFAAQKFDEARIENAATFAAIDQGVMNDALLYQATLRQTTDEAKAALLAVIAERAQAKGQGAKAAKIFDEIVKGITPTADLAGHAGLMVRMLLLAGDHEQAMAWYNQVRQDAYSGNLQATKGLLETWPLLVVAQDNEDVVWSADILELWWNSLLILSPEERAARATLFYVICEALGEVIPEAAWAKLAGAEMPAEAAQPASYAAWRGLIRAAQTGQQGEMILLTLLTLGEGGPAKTSPAVMNSIVRALQDAGMKQDARAIAIEALVDHGF